MPKKTEAQTRQQIIDQRLKKAGWDVNEKVLRVIWNVSLAFLRSATFSNVA